MQRFRDHPDQARVLSVYRGQALSMTPRELMRCACHVASWVALLPEAIVAQPLAGGDAVSPAQLLAELLRLRGRRKISGWLRGILYLVALRLKEVRKSASPQAAEHWRQLRQSIPRSVWKALRLECPALRVDARRNSEEGSLHESGARGCRVTLGMVRKKQKLALAHIQSFSRPDKDGCFARFESRASAALMAGLHVDPDAVADAIVDGVALLAPPRGCKTNWSGVEMPDEAGQDRKARGSVGSGRP